MPFPDLSLYVPVVCETDSKYAGKCYMEKISSVRTLNGNPVSNLKKSDFKTGDIVTIRFQTKDFRGTVDFFRDEEVLYERGDSPHTSRSTAWKSDERLSSSTFQIQRTRDAAGLKAITKKKIQVLGWSRGSSTRQG